MRNQDRRPDSPSRVLFVARLSESGSDRRPALRVGFRTEDSSHKRDSIRRVERHMPTHPPVRCDRELAGVERRMTARVAN